MFYKIVVDDIVVDATEELNYVLWQEKNRIWLSCDERYAKGIVSTNGESIWLLPSAPDMDGYSHCEIIEIGEEEYREIRDEIDAGEEVPYTPDEGEEVPEPDTPGKTRIQQLEENVEMLTECLLEMSEIVYGGEL